MQESVKNVRETLNNLATYVPDYDNFVFIKTVLHTFYTTQQNYPPKISNTSLLKC